LNVGLSKKIGQPDYGSLGATCHVDVELDGAMLQQDLETFHRHVRNAYVACAQAVNDELARHTDGGNGETPRAQPAQHPAGNGHHGNGSNGNGANGNGNGANGHRASQKQVDYLNQLARPIRGLGIRRLETLADKMFGKPVADLTSLDASGLIDTLKAIKAGDIDLEAALNGASA
jgi:hypothetical protein